MGDMDRFEVRISSQGIDVNLQEEDMESGLMT